MGSHEVTTVLQGLRAGDLLAVRLPTGPEWTAVLRAAWDAGAAVLPVDPRLPPPAARTLLAVSRPTAELAGSALRRLSGGTPVAEGIALVMPTAATTGTPKLVELSGGAVTAAVLASARRLGAVPADPWLGCLPVAHMGGMLVALRGLLLGSRVTLSPRFDVAEVEAFALSEGGFTALVPTMLARLLDADVPLARLRGILVGGDTLQTSVAARAAAKNAPVVRTYGMTETCGGVVYDGVPFEGVEVRIADGGEVLVRGSVLMSRYRLDPSATARAIDHEGWFHTGDGGRWEDGRLHVDGRLVDVIVSGGEKVWPAEVEEVLTQQPAVAEAAVAGVPDPDWGQRVVAFVVPASPSDPVRLERLRDIVAERLPRFKAPRELRIVDAIPRTEAGKVRRDVLVRLSTL